MPKVTVQLLPTAKSAFAVHLILDEEEESTATFLTGGGAQAGERRYQAVLVTETGATLEQATLRVADLSTDLPFHGEDTPDNATIESSWATARADHLALLEASDFFPEILLPGDPQNSAIPSLLPPTLFCPIPGRFFPIPCPHCLQPMNTCRDDAILVRTKLPLYSTSQSRLLFCAHCNSGSNVPQFFAPEAAKGNDELHGDLVGNLKVLRTLLAAKLDSLEDEEQPSGPKVVLPCVTCREVGSCLGAKKLALLMNPQSKTRKSVAKSPKWQIFNPHDAPYILTRSYPHKFDDFVQALGGGKAPSTEPLSPGFLFALEGSGILALEVLALKLLLFHQFARAVLEYQRRLGLPHLDLQPSNVEVDQGFRSENLPYLWDFQIKIDGSSSASLVRISGDFDVMLPPRSPCHPFSSPSVTRAQLAQIRIGDFVLGGVDQGPETGNGWQIRGSLEDPDGIFPEAKWGDLLRLQWPAKTLDKDPITAFATLGGSGRASDSGSLPITTVPLDISEDVAQRLAERVGSTFAGVRYRVFPRLHVGDDVYSMGVLLLRVLLVNDEQNLGSFGELLSGVPQRPIDGESGGGKRWERDVEGYLTKAESQWPHLLNKSNLLFRAAERGPDRPDPIPDEIWRSVLSVAIGMIAQGPQFGFAPDQPYQESQPSIHVEKVVKSLDYLVRRVQSILFQRQPLHLEIHSIIAELLTEEDQQ